VILAAAVTTAPRPRDTLPMSLSSMYHAGFRDPVLLLSDHAAAHVMQTPHHIPPLTIIRNDPPLGGLKNWCQALQLLIERTEARWLMVCEDDITWAPGAAAPLEHDLNMLDGRPVGYVSLYIARKVSREIEQRKQVRRLSPGLHRSELGEGVWGSQAYVLPRTTAAALLADPTFDDLRRNYVKNRNRDGIVSGALHRMGLPLFFRVPALVSHKLGEANSSLREKPVQQSLLCDYWTGRP
jgi:hypothetical protein